MEYENSHQNYCRLKTTIAFLQNGGRITEEWMEEHKRHILKYREMFANLAHVNEGEIEESEFRKNAKEAETLLSYLTKTIQTTNTFPVKYYLKLNERLLYLCDTAFNHDELNDAMNMLSM